MSGNVDAGTSTGEGSRNLEAKTATASTAKPKDGDAKAPGLRLNSGPPEDKKYRYAYPPTPGYMLGSGN